MQSFLKREVRTPYAYAAAVSLAILAWVASQSSSVLSFPTLALIDLVCVLASGAIGGLGPALITASVGFLSVDYFFIPPSGTFKLPYAGSDYVLLAAF